VSITPHANRDVVHFASSLRRAWHGDGVKAAPLLLSIALLMGACAPVVTPPAPLPRTQVRPPAASAPTAVAPEPAPAPSAAGTRAPAPGSTSAATPAQAGSTEQQVLLPLIESFEGVASWYGPGFAGRRTASGEVFDPAKLTAAHRSLPFGTMLRVTNTQNGRSVVVRVNDRGPFIAGRVIDLSRGAAEAIGMIGAGIARVRVEPLDPGDASARLGVMEDLGEFEARSQLLLPGTLLVLVPSENREPVMVRVVPGDVGSGGADLFVSAELFALLGPIVGVRRN